ncbi:MAG: hypothetical protein QOC81_3724 [Thermoanaerobaculia bacterium]|jgi:hypothetical protein|nr:hypothetical protein [Thermoanaerobaculia bacterium]
MSYLDIPRISFYGQFFANPSTINNATENYSLTEEYNNNQPSAANPHSVWWNPNGQAFFQIPGPPGQILPPPSCGITGAIDHTGTPQPSDGVIGAVVMNLVHGGPPPHYGRLVDLDPDQQSRSMIVGVQLQISINGVAAITGTVNPMNIIDLWGRNTTNPTSGLNVPGCMYQSVMTDVQWGDLSASPVLQQLQSTTNGGQLSIKFNVDGYNGNSGVAVFNYGRVVGTIGPYFTGEPMHFVPKRKMSAVSSLVTAPPSLFNAPFQLDGTDITIDLGNSIPMQYNASNQLVPVEVGPVSLAVVDATGQNLSVQIYPAAGTFELQYAFYAGVFTFGLSQTMATALASAPGTLSITPPGAMTASITGSEAVQLKQGMPLTSMQAAPTPPPPATIQVAEDPSGYYAAVDFNALRLENGQPSWSNTPGASTGAFITGNVEMPIWVMQWGNPAAATINISSYPNYYQFPDDEGSFQPINNVPLAGITFPASVTTDSKGFTTFTVTANSLSPSDRTARRAALDSQLYLLYHDYTTDAVPPSAVQPGGGPLVPPMTFLIFEDQPVVASPTWFDDVYPVFLQYARLYPFMRSLIDLSNYASVTNTEFGWAAAIQAMLQLPMDDPAFMPVTRDLSLVRRQMILTWYMNGSPLGLPPLLPGLPIPPTVENQS